MWTELTWKDRKGIPHLQNQVLRELLGSEVQTQSGRQTLHFHSPRSRECPVSLLLAWQVPALSAQDAELDGFLGCTCPPMTLASAYLCPLSPLWVPFIWNMQVVCPLCQPHIYMLNVPQGWFSLSTVGELYLDRRGLDSPSPACPIWLRVDS